MCLTNFHDAVGKVARCSGLETDQSNGGPYVIFRRRADHRDRQLAEHC